MANPANMTPGNQALAQLKDIHLPDAIGLWPLAPGWWIVISLATALTLWLCWQAWQRHLRNRAKKRALVLLQKFKQRYQQQGNTTETAALLSTLLRRVAIAYFPRHDVAGLKGANWVNFLDSHAKQSLFAPIKELLLALPYQGKSEQSLSPLFDACESWIKEQGKKHKPTKNSTLKRVGDGPIKSGQVESSGKATCHGSTGASNQTRGGSH